jgi:hypothetical protein
VLHIAPGESIEFDVRDLAEGTVLYLPVEVAGALFSVGDTHAAQATVRFAAPPLKVRCEWR